jgi:hypothetical protein
MTKPSQSISDNKSGLQDDHDPRDLAQKQNDQKISKDGRGQEQPTTKERVQQTDVTQEASKAYAPSNQDAKGQPQNPPKEEQEGEQKKQPGQQY